MKIKNANTYAIMYGYEFIKPGCEVEVEESLALQLLKQPGIEEVVDKKQLRDLEKENEELKKQLNKQANDDEGRAEIPLDLEQLKEQAKELGISFRPNISAEKLLAKIQQKNS